MLTLLGFAMGATFMALIMSRRVTPLIALMIDAGLFDPLVRAILHVVKPCS